MLVIIIWQSEHYDTYLWCNEYGVSDLLLLQYHQNYDIVELEYYDISICDYYYYDAISI